MQIRSSFDIFIVIDGLYRYLEKQNIGIDEDGFPVFEPYMFLSEWPEMVVPFSQRNNRRVRNKKKALICFFDKDQHLYSRFAKVFDEIDEYKKYMGVVGIDVTITDDMDCEWQKAVALLNQLFLAVLAVNGIKIVMNTRSAGIKPHILFKNVPHGVMVSSGFLGCDQLTDDKDFSYLEKIIFLLPDKLVIYGKRDPRAEKQLEIMGIDYRVYKDFHRLCQGV